MCEGGVDLGKGTDDKPLSQDLHPPGMSALRFQNFTSPTPSFETLTVSTQQHPVTALCCSTTLLEGNTWFSREKEGKGRERDREGTVGGP